jgi:hypothetical protein
LGGVRGWIGFRDKVTEGTYRWGTGEDCPEIYDTPRMGANAVYCNVDTRDAFLIEFDRVG